MDFEAVPESKSSAVSSRSRLDLATLRQHPDDVWLVTYQVQNDVFWEAVNHHQPAPEPKLPSEFDALVLPTDTLELAPPLYQALTIGENLERVLEMLYKARLVVHMEPVKRTVVLPTSRDNEEDGYTTRR